MTCVPVCFLDLEEIDLRRLMGRKGQTHMDADVIGKIAERKIQEAIEEGKFDNLPGKGQPLVFDDDPMTPPHLRLANKVLKNAGVLPDWVQIQKEIASERQEIEKQRARLIREHQTRRARLAALPASHPQAQLCVEWHAKSRAAYLRRLKGVNTSILKFNILAPSTATVYTPYKIEEEMARFDAEFPPLERVETPVLEEEAQQESLIKGIARARYREGDGGGPVRGWVKTARLLGHGSASGSGISEAVDAEDMGRADVPDDWKPQR